VTGISSFKESGIVVANITFADKSQAFIGNRNRSVGYLKEMALTTFCSITALL